MWVCSCPHPSTATTTGRVGERRVGPQERLTAWHHSLPTDWLRLTAGGFISQPGAALSASSSSSLLSGPGASRKSKELKLKRVSVGHFLPSCCWTAGAEKQGQSVRPTCYRVLDFGALWDFFFFKCFRKKPNKYERATGRSVEGTFHFMVSVDGVQQTSCSHPTGQKRKGL